MLAAAAATLLAAVAADKSILVIGDSWGTDIAGGSTLGLSAFQRKLKEKGCAFTEKNIAIAGSTAQQWAAADKLKSTAAAVKNVDYVWITLMGNDALAFGSGCAKRHPDSAPACGDELLAKVSGWMNKIIDNIHDANPDAKVVGFGYDIMFGGVGCPDVALGVFPQCKKEADKVTCFNTQFIRLQTDVWEPLAANRTYVAAPNFIGVTQVAGGDKAAQIGKPDLSQWGPAKYWPTTLACIHPSVLSGGDGSGAMLIMEQFYQKYWNQELGC